MTNTLNPNVFSNLDVLSLARELTGCETDWDLGDDLQAAGLPFAVADNIDSKTIGLVSYQVNAAFLAGYMIGRNPDLLILGALGSIFTHPTEE